MTAGYAPLLILIEKFVSGDDVSIELANAIEASLDDAFPDDDGMQDVVLMLASYRPEGGGYLYGEEEMRKTLRKVLVSLEAMKKGLKKGPW